MVGVFKLNSFTLPEMGSRIASEEDYGLGWIYVGINPPAPSCNSSSECLKNV